MDTNVAYLGTYVNINVTILETFYINIKKSLKKLKL